MRQLHREYIQAIKACLSNDDELSLPALLAELGFIDKKLLERPSSTSPRHLVSNNRELRTKMLLHNQKQSLIMKLPPAGKEDMQQNLF